ncbi:MAG: 16S rRNA (cytidine(1402)-2'-O)-methyltransferase, partial [Acidimicrobiales bacterium]
ITLRALRILREVDLIAAEDTRRTRTLLAKYDIPTPTTSYFEHNKLRRGPELVGRLRAGARVALVTDAGTPGISDPGFHLVRLAREAGVPVVPIPGASAVVAALSAAGLPGDRFVFEGFLPRRGAARRQRVAALAGERRALVLYEAPHRVVATVDDLLAACGPERPVAVARELTKLHEEVWRGTLAGAAEHLATVPPRGEYVLVLEGAPEPPAATDEEIEEALTARLRAGEDRRGAVAAVAGELEVGRRRVYELAVRLGRA